MNPSRVKARWAQGKPVLCVLNHLVDARATEVIATMGFDCIWIDLEHGERSTETLAHLCRAARLAGADVMARPAKGEFMRMGRLLEAGAHGILYPRCESVEEAREVVRWAKFPPLGERGFDSGNADNTYGEHPATEYVPEANRQTWIAIQIESPNALPHARAIAEVDGVDMIFFGPCDYSNLSGKIGLFRDPSIMQAARQIAKDTRAAGKHFGTLAFDLGHAKQLLDLGATFLNCGADIGMLRRSLAEAQRGYAELGFCFGRIA
ncbi:aldolase [bacterium]|nr:aldolase [bacterium]